MNFQVKNDILKITGDRQLYESSIYPSSYLIQPVGIGSTVLYVDNIRPFFNPINEATDITFQNNVSIISQDSKLVLMQRQLYQ
jgi:hypothetical protein